MNEIIVYVLCAGAGIAIGTVAVVALFRAAVRAAIGRGLGW